MELGQTPVTDDEVSKGSSLECLDRETNKYYSSRGTYEQVCEFWLSPLFSSKGLIKFSSIAHDAPQLTEYFGCNFFLYLAAVMSSFRYNFIEVGQDRSDDNISTLHTKRTFLISMV